jgi:hypothetical protein
MIAILYQATRVVGKCPCNHLAADQNQTVKIIRNKSEESNDIDYIVKLSL